MKGKKIKDLTWLKIVAKRHDEWIKIVNGFGEYNYAEDLVQQSYFTLIKYADPNKIIKDGKMSRGYMFFVLRTLFLQYYNQKNKISKIRLDSEKCFLQIEDTTNLEEQEAYHKVCKLVDKVADDWSWYDKKLWTLYSQTDMSIRKLAEETNISWVSIFNTLKKCKQDIREKLNEDYLDYKNEDYGRI